MTVRSSGNRSTDDHLRTAIHLINYYYDTMALYNREREGSHQNLPPSMLLIRLSRLIETLVSPSFPFLL